MILRWSGLEHESNLGLLTFKVSEIWPGQTGDCLLRPAKPGVYAERIDHFKLRAYFERVFGPELDGKCSDKTDLFGHALQTVLVGQPQATMMATEATT